MNGTDKLPQIAVTKPKMGFASDLGRTTNIVQTMRAAEGSVVKAPDHHQQFAEAGMDTPSSNVGVNWSGSQPHVVPPSVLSTCPATDLHDHTQRETTSPVTKECMSAQLPQMESGQSDATDNSITEVSPLLTVVPSQEAPSQTVTSTGFMTPVTKVSADELMMERAMRRTAERNLDGPIVHQHRGSAQPTPTHFSAASSDFPSGGIPEFDDTGAGNGTPIWHHVGGV